ncbi:hypothetical protein [Paenibacillus glacialis]|uniref:PAS domain-containing protein n=1 Tax=Paenibacillus glacialis TaxID=494026 RepID=A0A168NWS4_9BACL|nr:hypothetical protein [Paenibacillus glacialis]OAB46169.1 hypothetical protein PGLA_01905 [Paenibacillus glacialis]
MTNLNTTLHNEIIHSLQQSIAVLDCDGCVITVNPAWIVMSTSNKIPSDFQWIGVNFFQICESSFLMEEIEINTLLITSFHSILQGHIHTFSHNFSMLINHKTEWFVLDVSPLLTFGMNSIKGAIVTLTNITASKQLEHDLQESLSQIRTLRGLIPICAVCKRIKDDELWNAIENFLEKHTYAEFTHDICPDCIRSLYPKYSFVLDRPSES